MISDFETQKITGRVNGVFHNKTSLLYRTIRGKNCYWLQVVLEEGINGFPRELPILCSDNLTNLLDEEYKQNGLCLDLKGELSQENNGCLALFVKRAKVYSFNGHMQFWHEVYNIHFTYIEHSRLGTLIQPIILETTYD